MQRISLIVFLLLGLSCQKQSSDERINFITSDIDLFWEMYDTGDYSPENILDNYIARGTPGLFDFAIQKGLSTALTFTLNQERFQQYYSSIRENTLDIKDEYKIAEKAFLKLEEVHPETQFHNVFFVIGALTAGGRISENGLIIAVELFTKANTSNTDDLSDWQQTVIRQKEFIPGIVFHEFIHLQQKAIQQQSTSGTLLEQAILEGMSDYITTLILPDEPFFNDHLYAFGDSREETIWIHFKTEMDKPYQDTEWLYTGKRTNRGYPADMGYYVGFKIAEAYAATFEDKDVAISQMLMTTDYKALFAQSRYADKFE